MSWFEILVIGVGLAMDAVCVSISNGMCIKKSSAKHALADACAFGIFQGIMPLIGFFAGSLIIGLFSKYSFILVFSIFVVLGGKMIYDAVHEPNDGNAVCKQMTFKLLLIQAIATSIDALAVGVSFSAVSVNIYIACALIAGVTFVLAFISFLLGKKIGIVLNKKAGIFGGILLLLIAANVLLQGI